MIRSLVLSAAFAVVTAASASAATFSVSFTGSPILVTNNDFLGLLTPLTRYVDTGAGITLNGPATVDFYYLGSESGYNNTFTAGSTTFTETGDANHFASPVFIGSQTYAGGAITSWRFTSNTGPAASVGQNGFGIFLQPSATTPVSGLSSLILGYDDQQFTGDDDNHDDLMILARIRAPEPSSWAIMITGFGLAGAALRRRRTRRPPRAGSTLRKAPLLPAGMAGRAGHHGSGTLQHPDAAFDREGEVALLAEVMHGPQDVRVRAGAVVTAEDAARLQARVPVRDVRMEAGVVVQAVKEDEVQALERPVGEVVRAAPAHRRDVVAARV
jgi:hypothetical protein